MRTFYSNCKGFKFSNIQTVQLNGKPSKLFQVWRLEIDENSNIASWFFVGQFSCSGSRTTRKQLIEAFSSSED